jgi:hypothetical protein
MNINPDKTPVLTPPPPGAVVHGPALSIAEQRASAEQQVAKDPNSTPACYFADGSVAGLIIFVKVHPNDPITNPAADCTRGWIGSTPPASARP